MKEQFEALYPAENLYWVTVMKPAKRLLGIAAARYATCKSRTATKLGLRISEK